MTPGEFKAWFEGFTEAFEKVPNLRQWAKIKDRVAEIDSKQTTQAVYVDRYWPPYTPRPYYYPYIGTMMSSGDTSTLEQAATANAMQGSIDNQKGYQQNYQANLGSTQSAGSYNDGSLGQWDSFAEMKALGRADAESMS